MHLVGRIDRLLAVGVFVRYQYRAQIWSDITHTSNSKRKLSERADRTPATGAIGHLSQIKLRINQPKSTQDLIISRPRS